MIPVGRISKLLVAIAPIIAVVLILSEVVITNRLAILGSKLTDIDKQIQQLEEDNGRLSSQVASASSITTISDRAQHLGFAQAGQYVSFGLDQFSIALGNN